MDTSLYKKLGLPQSQQYFAELYEMSFGARTYKENTIVFFAPISGIEYRFRHIEKYASLVSKNFEVISYSNSMASASSTRQDVKSQLNNYFLDADADANSKVCILAKVSANSSHQALETLLHEAQEMYLKSNGSVTFCIYTDLALCPEQMHELKSKYRACFQNVYYTQYYTDHEVLNFLRHTAVEWSLKPSREILSYFVALAGGVLYFAKELMRIHARNPKANYKKITQFVKSSSEIWNRAEIFLKSLPPDLQAAVQDVAIGKNITNDQYKKCLDLNLINITKSGVSLRSLLLKRHILSKSLGLNPQINTQDLGFAVRERSVFDLLYTSLGSVVKRDAIAKLIWQDREYSEIALDQVINRLRKKISITKPLRQYVIKTHKKIGFELTI